MDKDFLKDLKKINQLATVIEESDVGNISEWISTGSLSMNSKISGSIYNGVPAGRVISLIGESGTGKSFIAGRVAANAQKKDYDVIYFDSENAITTDFLKRLGVNTKELISLSVETLEEFRNQTYKILDRYEEKYFEKGKRIGGKKLLIILDSLGNLPAQKELDDAAKGHDALDMGLRAKIIKSMTRLLTAKLARLNVPLLITNHTYKVASPNPKVPPTEVPQGGRGVVYISTIIVLLTKAKVKEDKEDTKKISGNTLKILTTKNRIIPEQQKAEIKVDFASGPVKYHGILEDAVEAGAVIREGNKYSVPHSDKKYFSREMMYGGDKNGLSADEIWEPVLPELDKYIQENNKFSSMGDDEVEYETMDESIENIDNDETIDSLNEPSDSLNEPREI